MKMPLRPIGTVLLAAVVGALVAAGTIYLIARDMLGPDQMRAVVRAVLMTEPAIITDALDAGERNQQAQIEATRAKALEELADALYRDPGSPSIGNPEASVTVVEFFDYRCPYCKHVAPELATLLATDADVRVVYKEFPILGPESVFASKAALAAHRQGKYRELHEALLGLEGGLDDATVLRVAGEVGLDLPKLQQDMESPAIIEQLQAVRSLATALGVNGTPAFVIGKDFIGGAISVDEMRELVARNREG